MLNAETCACECPSGTTFCSGTGTCTDLKRDDQNRGRCAAACPAGGNCAYDDALQRAVCCYPTHCCRASGVSCRENALDCCTPEGGYTLCPTSGVCA